MGAVREVPVAPSYTALVDAVDYDRVVTAGPWRAQASGSVDNPINYAKTHTTRNGVDTSLYMHNLVSGGGLTDHKNSDGLDNRRDNLRAATHQQNMGNQRPRLGRSSRYKGVSWCKAVGKWRAYIRVHGEQRHLGCFDAELDAALAYDLAAQKPDPDGFGEFARPNLVTWGSI